MRWLFMISVAAFVAGAVFDGHVAAAAVLAARLAAVLAALTLHECAHGVTALALGDTTARDAGRLTLNPLAHFDLLGMVVVPVALAMAGAPAFGWAKPVPVSFSRLRRPRRDTLLVAMAGPAASLVSAAVSAVLLRLVGGGGLLGAFGWMFVAINLAFGVFNLLPLYPMDGGRIVAAALPEQAAAWLARHEGAAQLVTLALLIGGPLVLSFFGVDVLGPLGVGYDHITDWLTGAPADVWLAPVNHLLSR